MSAPELADPVVASPDIPPDLTPERSIAASWRIPHKQLAEIRHEKLKKKIHWDIVHYTVCYTVLGVEKLKDLISEGALKPRPIELPPTQAELDLKEQIKLKQKWKVVRIPPNPRLLLVENMWSEEKMWIGVRANKLFRRGMVVHDFELSSPDAMSRRHLLRKLPRSYGRW